MRRRDATRGNLGDGTTVEWKSTATMNHRYAVPSPAAEMPMVAAEGDQSGNLLRQIRLYLVLPASPHFHAYALVFAPRSEIP
jgi:hypothetical protein